MTRLNLPAIDYKLRNIQGETEIFDVVRKKFILLSPEEWVRQHFIHYLNHQKGVPLSLMAIEYSLKVNKMRKRADIVVFGTGGQPILIVECKASSIKISQKVFDQVARYNMAVKVKYLVVTNGLEHFACQVDFTDANYAFLEEIPDFEQMNERVI
jgi:type I site-specific restriction endonuclease